MIDQITLEIITGFYGPARQIATQDDLILYLLYLHYLNYLRQQPSVV